MEGKAPRGPPVETCAGDRRARGWSPIFAYGALRWRVERGCTHVDAAGNSQSSELGVFKLSNTVRV